MCACVFVRERLFFLYLYKAAHHILIKHGQTGPALSEYVQSVYRHDNGLGPRFIHDQNVDSAVAQANRVVCHSEENSEKHFEKQSVPNLSLTQRPIYSVTGQGRL